MEAPRPPAAEAASIPLIERAVFQGEPGREGSAAPSSRADGVAPTRVLRLGLLSLLLIGSGALVWSVATSGSGARLVAEAAALVSGAGFWQAAAVGFLAQAVDGALGMAYGLTASTFLMATGASPLAATAAVHVAEVFTTGASGLSHLRLGNVDRALLARLLLPGLAGTVLGAWLATRIDGAALKPVVAVYLLAMGLLLLLQALRRRRRQAAPAGAPRPPRHVAKLALTGGFVDAVGGGGWGPVVTGTLLGSGHEPRRAIGTVNLAEFFLTFAGAGVFVLLATETPWAAVAGLVVGGVAAAPLAARLTRHLHPRVLLALVGALIVVLSGHTLLRAVPF